MNLKLDDFIYDLPEDRIAKHPAKERAGSKLLFYNQGKISHHEFKQIDNLILDDSLLVFNDTKVIPARIIMHKDSGARIEIFLLEPIKPSTVHEEVMNAKTTCTWKCMIGNAKKWKLDTSLKIVDLDLTAKRVGQDEVMFSWESELTFSDLLTEIGKIPLPPYIDREVEHEDEERYQTVYSKMKGAVAAPTAGLHFTNEIIGSLKERGIKTDYLTLHVSAGTFQPIKSENISDHPMHNEQIWVSKQNVESLLNANKVIAVGTTSMRTLESLYWYGTKLLSGIDNFFVDKSDPYTLNAIKREDALHAVLEKMEKTGVEKLGGHTEIFIYPGYEFQICDGLITNYHLPGSTLILLVASFIGEDWRKVYESALGNNYRFLSYGDSSLLIR
ncbi:S-adenosylmethionine:tRNA ribosyltransferase-isomerase [Ekhidna sp.]|uniref:S-adenosylmethionine:tRNA ribosyltransferase-isomerase n=1 Tax=Ekhidna sp. TaxID=2608089 RepID=UPI003C7C0F67